MAAPADADPFDVDTWRAANPSYDAPGFGPLRAVIAAEADEAKADPSLLPGFRALCLNGGVADHAVNVLIDADASQRCERDILPERRGPKVLAFDLSGGDAMVAVAYHPASGRREAMAAFPELPSLADRGRADASDYEAMHADGDLRIMGRRVVPVAELVRVALAEWGRPAR